ncbi:MAG: metal ABC transporter permease [Chloroflexota bacterium]|nr:metal ABC transporter permease [Chloroflexota bacterium]
MSSKVSVPSTTEKGPSSQSLVQNASLSREWLWIAAIAGLCLLLIPLSALLFGVQWTHTLRTVALGGGILGLVTGALGSFAVLRQESLLGDALSHAALPGIAIAFLISGRELTALLVGAAVAGWLGVLLVRAIVSTTRIKQDAAMAIVLSSFFAFGLALLAYIQGRDDASQAGLKSFIFGQAAAIVERDVWTIGLVGGAALLLLLVFWKEFKLITFDMAFARANGIPTRALDLMLSTLIVVAIVLGLQLAGVILMVGLLIAPAVAARQWTRKLEQMVVLAAVFGAASGASGAVASAIEAGLPTGPLIIVAAVLIAFLSLAFAPERGIVWSQLKQRADRRAFAAQTMLRDLYRHCCSHDDMSQPTDEAMLVRLRGAAARAGLRDLARDGLAVMQPRTTQWRLTPEGVLAAAQMADNGMRQTREMRPVIMTRLEA